MPWLLPAALALAARQLATGPGGKPQFAQALVELVLDQGIVEPQRAQRAVHAVLQAYYDAGDYAGVSMANQTASFMYVFMQCNLCSGMHSCCKHTMMQATMLGWVKGASQQVVHTIVTPLCRLVGLCVSVWLQQFVQHL